MHEEEVDELSEASSRAASPTKKRCALTSPFQSSSDIYPRRATPAAGYEEPNDDNDNDDNFKQPASHKASTVDLE